MVIFPLAPDQQQWASKGEHLLYRPCLYNEAREYQ